MNFDINAIIKEMLEAVKNEVANNWDKIKDTASDFLQGHKDRLQELAAARISGEIDDEFLKKRLADEEDNLKAELLAEKIIAESAAQQAANAAIDVLSKAVK